MLEQMTIEDCIAEADYARKHVRCRQMNGICIGMHCPVCDEPVGMAGCGNAACREPKDPEVPTVPEDAEPAPEPELSETQRLYEAYLAAGGSDSLLTFPEFCIGQKPLSDPRAPAEGSPPAGGFQESTALRAARKELQSLIHDYRRGEVPHATAPAWLRNIVAGLAISALDSAGRHGYDPATHPDVDKEAPEK